MRLPEQSSERQSRESEGFGSIASHPSFSVPSKKSPIGFRIRTIQVDNGSEFINDHERTDRLSAFEKAVAAEGMALRRTRPYSPWQNGKVERSHREDGKILYSRRYYSEKMLREAMEKHVKRYNSTAKTVLGFRSPNQLVSEYFSTRKCNTCLGS